MNTVMALAVTCKCSRVRTLEYLNVMLNVVFFLHEHKALLGPSLPFPKKRFYAEQFNRAQK